LQEGDERFALIARADNTIVLAREMRCERCLAAHFPGGRWMPVTAAKKIPETNKTEKVIVARPTRERRAALFQSYVLTASVVSVALAVPVHFIPHFAIDLTVTRAIQSNHGALADHLMRGLSWIGFPPQVIVIAAIVLLTLFASGLRWEAEVAHIVPGEERRA
jgi:hypothetical protein